ncbi:MAG TPA: hypothetical protein VJ777_31510 [Mycobacterium sp.]|nr:hypothetical protein [Mycobacterium sp.]
MNFFPFCVVTSRNAYPARRAANRGDFTGTLVPGIALSPTSCALVSTNKGLPSMTALQDWLPIRPIDPKSLKALICDAIRGLTADEPATVAEPQLIRRGVERC